ncbi:MAG: four helix bundle protein [Sphingobacteriales bacterium]|nr:MAG: four helix bundle protein [Sphingobacteriales bacterium]
MSFKFESLRVWQNALEYGEKINNIADGFSRKELFNLCTQVRRAADSIGLNIAEGPAGLSDLERSRFLTFANRSALETAACLIKARRRLYMSESQFNTLYKECEQLVKMIQAFKNKLK